jgi:hypothetical protein
MIHYGLACMFVCVLSLADRRAIPIALTVLVGWTTAYLFGLAVPEWAWRTWAPISAVSAILLTWFWHRDPDWRWKAVASLAGVMLLLDVAYLGFRWQRVPIEVEYSRALDFCLSLQLLLIGFRGVTNGWNSFWRRLFRGLGRGGLVGHEAYRKADEG